MFRMHTCFQDCKKSRKLDFLDQFWPKKRDLLKTEKETLPPKTNFHEITSLKRHFLQVKNLQQGIFTECGIQNFLTEMKVKVPYNQRQHISMFSKDLCNVTQIQTSKGKRDFSRPFSPESLDKRLSLSFKTKECSLSVTLL